MTAGAASLLKGTLACQCSVGPLSACVLTERDSSSERRLGVSGPAATSATLPGWPVLMLPSFLAPTPPASLSLLLCRGAWLLASAGWTGELAPSARHPAAALLAGTTCSRGWQTVAKA